MRPLPALRGSQEGRVATFQQICWIMINGQAASIAEYRFRKVARSPGRWRAGLPGGFCIIGAIARDEGLFRCEP